jgi:hypothetical protein
MRWAFGGESVIGAVPGWSGVEQAHAALPQHWWASGIEPLRISPSRVIWRRMSSRRASRARTASGMSTSQSDSLYTVRSTHPSATSAKRPNSHDAHPG